MESIIAHGRMDFIKSKKPEGCVFCKNSIRDNRLILFEDTGVFIIMNKYPYNTGHLLIIPDRHISRLEEMTADERTKMFDCLDLSVRILQEVMGPEGFNIGMNLGQAGGAGIADHLHLHIVPRWSGDTNFMTCVANTRVTPEDVQVTCDRLKPHFEKTMRGK
jgi:ATP adenylyltransferase